MESIKILENEHENIKLMLEVLRRMAMSFIERKELNTDHFRLVCDFISFYADGHHHDKEEKILFDYMLDHSGPEARTLIRQGMLVEHDIARYYNRSLRQVLDDYDKYPGLDNGLEVLTFSLAYRDLLTRHIDKENNAVFPLAERTLPEDIKDKNEEDFRVYQEKNKAEASKYLANLEYLQNIYL